MKKKIIIISILSILLVIIGVTSYCVSRNKISNIQVSEDSILENDSSSVEIDNNEENTENSVVEEEQNINEGNMEVEEQNTETSIQQQATQIKSSSKTTNKVDTTKAETKSEVVKETQTTKEETPTKVETPSTVSEPKNEFDSILKELSDLGYNNYWQVLNAKDYGIPQNRERVFIISIRKDIDNGKFIFPEKIQLQLKLKDLLEEVVDNKYYLTEKGIGRLIKRNNKLIRNNENPDVSSCIIAGYHKMDGRNNQYISEENKPKRIGGIYDTDERKRQAGGIYDPNAISPTLTTMFPGGDKQPFVLVNEGTKKGSSEAREGDSINISYPNNMKKRGRVGKEVSQTILTSPNMAVVENANKPICLNANKKVSIQDRIYDEEGISATVTASEFRPKIAERKMFNSYNNKEIKDIAPTQTANCGSTTSSAAVLISEDGSNYLKIRKLTPLECWRLMGFDDEDFYKAKNVGISDTQLYRQAGNSIVVNVLEEIFKTLLNLKLKNE